MVEQRSEAESRVIDAAKKWAPFQTAESKAAQRADERVAETALEAAIWLRVSVQLLQEIEK